MLDLFNLLVKKNRKTSSNLNSNIQGKSYKHFPSSLREWKNSIYVFNNNNVKLMPSTSELVAKLIKSYFNLYNKKLEFKMRTRKLLLRLRRLSSNKFYISNGEFKHTNNKVCINLYVFNRQKKNYLLTLTKWFLNHIVKGLSLQKESLLKSKLIKENNLKMRLNNWIPIKTWKKNSYKKNSKTNSRKIMIMRKHKVNTNVKIINRIRKIDNKGIEKLILINTNKDLLLRVLDAINNNRKYNISNFKSITKYTENFHKNLIQKSLKKIRMYFYYKQLVILNKSKLNYVYLSHLNKYLEKIYNKNVEFNIINIKRFYLNSDIISEYMTTRLEADRKNIIRYLNVLKDKILLKGKKVIAFDKPKQKLETRLEMSNQNIKLRNYILSNLKYKYLTGFRLEAKGRLSRRFTASRSVHKLKYKGSLLEYDSSNRGSSSVLLKGNLRSNIQFTKTKSKTRIGSFGIKGWISGN